MTTALTPSPAAGRADSRTVGHPGDFAAWLEVTRLGRADWRISDGRREQFESGHLLGYIEKIGRDKYEIVWMTDPMRWSYVDSLRAALEGFTDGARFSSPVLDERDRALVVAPRRSRRGRRRSSDPRSAAIEVA